MAVESPVDRPQEAPAGELSFCSSSFPKLEANPQDEISAVARNFSDQALLNPEPGVWAVLTAISKNARLRRQGMNMLLIDDEHSIGRCVEDPRFQIISMAISANHCKISREREAHPDSKADPNIPVSVFLKDTSTNGTYLNWVRLRKCSPKARLKHGDIISFVSPPHDDTSYAFVYREVPYSNAEGSKRKSEDLGHEGKRLKGIGIGTLDGPISLDDVRSLQRSNTELRHLLESHLLTIEALRNESRLINARRENELKEQKEALSISYDCQIKDLISFLDAKQKELNDLSATSAELQNSIKDLNERLDASMQSRADADEILNSQKATISELEAQLDDERNQRRAERETAEVDLKSALQRAHLDAQEELKRQADVYLRQHREQQEFISKFQESEKESRLLVETLRSKLEDARESLVTSEKKARQLEAQFQDEHIAFTNCRNKIEALESELRKLRKELENEKVAREEAWAKVSSLELEIAAAIHDLSIEKQRFQGARERIILRETQLRAFYSTTEEISALFAKQQEQLKAMQKTLEDQEKYENSLFAVDSNGPANLNFNPGPRENPKDSSSACTPNNSLVKNDGTDDSDDVCTTEKHNCDNRSEDGNTQDLECESADRLARGFGSEIDGVGAAFVPDEDPADTERVLGTESQVGDPIFNEKNAVFHKCNSLAGETMQIDDEVGAEDNLEPPIHNFDLKPSPSSELRKEDTRSGTIRTSDLLASEAAGSWAVDTAPSVNGENESPADHGVGGEAVAAACQMLVFDGQGAGSQSNNTTTRGIIKLTKEHQALTAMINLVAPDFRKKFSVGAAESDSSSGAETEGSKQSNAGGRNDKVCDSEGDSSDSSDSSDGVATDVVDAMIEDSVG